MSDIKFHMIGSSDADYPGTLGKDNYFSYDYQIKNKTVSFFYEPWKNNIKKIKKDDFVFLYKNGEGLVKYGIATSDPKFKTPGKEIIDKMKKYEDPTTEDENQEGYVEIDEWRTIEPPINYKEIEGHHRSSYSDLTGYCSIGINFKGKINTIQLPLINKKI